MSRPIGALMRSNAACQRPPAARRSRRRHMRLAAAERTDIEAAGVERGAQRHVIDLGIVRQRRDGGKTVEGMILQHRLRPFGMERNVRETIRRRKGGARIDDRDVEPASRAIGASAWLMCTAPIITRRGAGTWTLRNRSCPRLPSSPTCPRQSLGEDRAEFAINAVVFVDEPARAVTEVRTRIAARRARRAALSSLRMLRVHGRSAQPLDIDLMRPPQERPTRQAVSSATPNSSMRGAPSPMTSSASVTTAPSTQPPETEPWKLPSASITRWLPIGRGADPQVSTTVAMATSCRRPAIPRRWRADRAPHPGALPLTSSPPCPSSTPPAGAQAPTTGAGRPSRPAFHPEMRRDRPAR